jgi:hypothetical protein
VPHPEFQDSIWTTLLPKVCVAESSKAMKASLRDSELSAVVEDYRVEITAAGGDWSFASSLAKTGLSGNSAASSLSWTRATSGVFSRRGRERQQNLRKRPEVVAMIGGDPELLDARFPVAMDSCEGEENRSERVCHCA